MTVKCIECKNAIFQLTPTGRTKFAHGKCVAVVAYPQIGCVEVRHKRIAIWPDTEYAICEQFHKNEIKEPS